MKIDNAKLDMALAKKCMNLRGLRANMSAQTLPRIRQGADVRPATLGKLAWALGVDPAELLTEED